MKTAGFEPKLEQKETEDKVEYRIVIPLKKAQGNCQTAGVVQTFEK